ncbi:MAG TPA: carbohydrate kinase family protein [Roseiflexaceae bacterium]|nr:carbohydrate kinase family protein [Roseiflexaceae bacterium]
MARIVVAGLINYETTLRVDGFPLDYAPVRYPFFGVRGNAAGVGLNISAALTALGDEVRLLSLVGRDEAGRMALGALERAGIDRGAVRADLEQTCQSVILYDRDGRRAIFTDLKDIQERAYPPELFDQAATGCELAVICNINFARPLLARAAALGLPIATDVHALHDPDDAYNRDYMAAAQVLFLSHERLPCPPKEFVAELQRRYGTPVVVVGLGAEGALLALRGAGTMLRVPASTPRPVASTVGAGDALFSAFVSGYAAGLAPEAALRRAVVFAGYKIGAVGGAEGFVGCAELDRLVGAGGLEAGECTPAADSSVSAKDPLW